jgi:hypothetical protein
VENKRTGANGQFSAYKCNEKLRARLFIDAPGLPLRCGQRVLRADSGTQQAETVHLRSPSRAVPPFRFELDERGQHGIGAPSQSIQRSHKIGSVDLTGRTQEPGERTFGIAIFAAADEAAARAFMQADPAVASALMTAELHPFNVVLQRENP